MFCLRSTSTINKKKPDNNRKNNTISKEYDLSNFFNFLFT